MLINLSNHPFSTWPEAQQHDAIQHYISVVDIEFPHIEPEWKYEKLVDIANNLLTRVLSNKADAIYVVGEHVFTFMLVRLFQKNGLKCINAKSKRLITELENGSVSKSFQFKGFREYPF